MSDRDDCCEYDIFLPPEEAEGMEWLAYVIAERMKDPGGVGYDELMAVNRALARISQHCDDMHTALHMLEKHVEEQKIELAKWEMLTQPKESNA